MNIHHEETKQQCKKKTLKRLKRRKKIKKKSGTKENANLTQSILRISPSTIDSVSLDLSPVHRNLDISIPCNDATILETIEDKDLPHNHSTSTPVTTCKANIECKICHRVFSRNWLLKRHMLYHTQVYKC